MTVTPDIAIDVAASDNTEPYYGSKDRNEAWIAEAIWGHRIERQPFSALLLEFLGMAEGMFRQGKLFAETRPSENVQYVANRSLQLRNLLFKTLGWRKFYAMRK